MDLTLPSEALNWQRRAKAFAEEDLFPVEVDLELNGSLPAGTLDRLRRAVKEHGLNGVNHAKDVGGQGCSQLELTLIGEELGKATGALWAIVPAGTDRRLSQAELRDGAARLRRGDGTASGFGSAHDRHAR
jgi:acyl-CoA dehydrogenase